MLCHRTTTSGACAARPNAGKLRSQRPSQARPAHLGALTEHISPDLLDSALQATGTTQRRVRLLPARTMIYFIRALILYPHASYTDVG
ncbi:transposase domain-containing protein [Glutamicibacter protophormiae]|uniref:transposase domain-containing protein n=1 Tax=Glutamicibacter protophormiae TaxID=37930 RepID=UPI0035AC0A64